MTKNIYNPMSKEFQDECEKLGLTGRQLTLKYKKEGRILKEDEIYKSGYNKLIYTDKELLDYLIQFYKKYGRPPTERDFDNSSEYPSCVTYWRRFESWSAALKLVELDVESMVKKGVLDTTQQIGRFGEIIIRDHFENNPIDLAGDNQNSSCDGICPNGKTYDVKSSILCETSYRFNTRNVYKEEIEIYYFLAFNNKDHKKFDYGWRIPGEIVEKDYFIIGMYRAEFNIKNMKQYDITEKLREVLIKYGLIN